MMFSIETLPGSFVFINLILCYIIIIEWRTLSASWGSALGFAAK